MTAKSHIVDLVGPLSVWPRAVRSAFESKTRLHRYDRFKLTVFLLVNGVSPSAIMNMYDSAFASTVSDSRRRSNIEMIIRDYPGSKWTAFNVAMGETMKFGAKRDDVDYTVRLKGKGATKYHDPLLRLKKHNQSERAEENRRRALWIKAGRPAKRKRVLKDRGRFTRERNDRERQRRARDHQRQEEDMLWLLTERRADALDRAAKRRKKS